MIAHISIGARDVARARRFYDAALEPLGYTCLSSDEGSLGYGAEAPEFWVSGT
jgi:catechol 2,3-dioxygenase-like lactoylglutathione lyase family enzyme